LDADHSASAIATTPTIPDAVWFACRCFTLFVMMVLTEPGAAFPRFVVSCWVTDLPSRPSRETRTSRPGKIDWMPK
jgi:hypothetical protein